MRPPSSSQADPTVRFARRSEARSRSGPLGSQILLSRQAACGVVATTVLVMGPLVAPAYAAAVPSPRSVTAEVHPGSGVWPLDPRPGVVHGFHPPATRYGSGHRGVDLAGHPGQPVHTALAGRVSFAGRLAGRGVVVVDHGVTRTTYEPVLATVHVGDQVATGTRIGLLSLVGSHCFPSWCLHWGLIRGDTYLDPLTLVGAVPVVLMPRSGDGSAAVTRTNLFGRSTPLLSPPMAWARRPAPLALRSGWPRRASAPMAVTTGDPDGFGPDPLLGPDLRAPERSLAPGQVVVWPLAEEPQARGCACR